MVRTKYLNEEIRMIDDYTYYNMFTVDGFHSWKELIHNNSYY